MNKLSLATDLKQQVKAVLEAMGYAHFGFAQVGKPLSHKLYEKWLDEDLHGEMEYLPRHSELKKESHWDEKRIQSAIVIGFDYFKHPFPEDTQLQNLKIARYAKGRDYHFWLKEKLEEIVVKLKELYPDDVFLTATDSSPILERDLAFRAGLGWFGKNSMLIHQGRGSYFLIGEIMTSLHLSPLTEPSPDRCGTCTRCIDACPTDAILEDRRLDARKCISYWTIESKTSPPSELRDKFKGWFFGCDICQDVCPWNTKAHDTQQVESSRENMIHDIRWILTSSNKELERTLSSSPLSRARGAGLKRNALLLIAEYRLLELQDQVEGFVSDVRLGELANWTLAELKK